MKSLILSITMVASLASLSLADQWVFDPPVEQVAGDSQAWVIPLAKKQVIFFTSQTSYDCLKIQMQYFPLLREVGWAVSEDESAQVRIVDVKRNPDLWQRYGSEKDGLPQFVTVYDGEVIRSLRKGCATPMDQWGVGWLYHGVDERPEPKRERVTADSNGIYPVRGSWWSVEGHWNASKSYVIHHLLTSPNHTRLRPYADQIRRLSRVEAHSLHSDDHERRVNWSSLRGQDRKVSINILSLVKPSRERPYSHCPT